MSVELLNQIQSAEAEAERLHQEASREARDQIKAVEEAISSENRQTAAEIREAVQKVVSKARLETEDEIRSLKVRRSAERQMVQDAASVKVAHAAQVIFERIVQNGNR